MATASTIKFGDGLNVTDEGAGVIRVDAGSLSPPASDVTVDSTTLVGTGTDVQAVLEELDDAVAGTIVVANAALPAASLLRCRATADHAISSATETDVTGMGMVLEANSVYSFEFILMCSSNAATKGIQFYLTFPGTITRCDANLDYYITVSAKGSINVINDTTSPITFEPVVSHGNVVLLNRIVGTIEVGASGGTLQLQHGTEDATLSTVFRGSYGIAYKH